MRRAYFVPLILASAVLLLGCGGKEDGPELKTKAGGGPTAAKDDSAVVYKAPDGRTLTLDDLQTVGGTFHYEVIGKKDVTPEAAFLHRQALLASEAGDDGKAIALLERAAEQCPDWPLPFYDLADIYLSKDDYASAAKFYKKSLDLSPRGYFRAITALDTLQREQKGEFRAGTYKAYYNFVEEYDDPEEKLPAVRRLVKELPGFAPLWKELADVALDDSERLAAIEKGLEANPDAETKGMLLIKKAIVVERQGNRGAAIEILGALALDPQSTLETEHQAKSNLGIVARK
jgi:tetratricopeptide (TPR) repeat protein